MATNTDLIDHAKEHLRWPCSGYGGHHEMVAGLTAALEAAEADNAALLEALDAGIVYWNCNFNHHVVECVGRCSEQFMAQVERVRDDHPGAALWIELDTLRAAAEAARKVCATDRFDELCREEAALVAALDALVSAPEQADTLEARDEG